jgi:thiol-disulfide isomerase/thioredoxin
MEHAKVSGAILLVIAAFAFLFLSVRATTIADEASEALKPLPASQVQAAPDWNLPDAASGRLVDLTQEVKRHPVVFSFWATWCGPCHQELPHLERVSRKYRGQVAFYGIDSSDPPAAIMADAKRIGLTFPMLSDSRRDAATSYGAEAIPMLVVVDTHDQVRSVTVGYDDNENLEASLSKILNQLLPSPTG